MGRLPIRTLALRLAIAVAVLAAGPAHAAAQTIANVERHLLPFKGGLLDGVPANFWNSLSFLRTEEDRLRGTKADITFGLSGDEAGPRSLFKMNTGISLVKGVFPSEISVVSKLGLQLKDGQLQEDVTSLRITYDYHGGSHVEYFTFAERFTDSFLSIQHRYEIGFGARLGFSLGRVGRPDTLKKTDESLNTLLTGLPMTQAAMSALAPARLVPGITRLETEEFTRLKTAVDDLQHALAEEQTKLFIGFTAGVFAELERAELEVTSTPAAGGTAGTTKLAVDAEQRYRLSLRPTFKYRPSSSVVVLVYPYFKLPLDGPTRRTVNGERRLDYRRDILSETSWSLKPEQTGLESVAFVLTVNHFFDNVPPSLAPSVVDAALANGKILTNTVAARSHRVVALSLKLGW